MQEVEKMRIKIDDVEITNFFKMPKKIYDFDLKPVDRELYMLCSENWRLSVKNGWVNKNGEIFFYATQVILAKQMNVSKDTIIAAFERLVISGLLEVEKEVGKPNKYYLINLNQNEQVGNSDQSENSTTPVEKPDYHQSENSTTPVEKPDSNKNNTIRTNIVRINNKNIYSAVIDYLNEKTGKKFKASSKATQKLINSRLNEGYTEDDFKNVIDKKSKEWLGTEWENYLAPDTLFRSTKFERYLNQKEVRSGNSRHKNNYRTANEKHSQTTDRSRDGENWN